jgi:4-amino-4-deoxy-L-arabinose transferase-like glycosyltransferase
VLALWVRRRAGDWAAFCALALYAFDPNVIAHGRYTTNDLAVSAFFFLACVLWDRALRRATASDYAFAGLALGLALGTKFSAVLLLPIFVLLALARRPKPRPALLGALVSCAVAFAIVAALYRGRPGMYADGLRMVSSIGHISYLLGQDSRDGWWYYFPVAFAVKTPVALFALIAVAAFAVWRRRGVPSRLAVLVVPIAFYGVSCLFSRADIGLRYLLPIYPMLYALLAIVAGGAPRWLVALCVVAFGAESAAVYPNYLAFFNVLVGGPAQGPKYLLDSNIDWGQDLDKTKRWLQARGIDHVCMAYFGNVPAAYFGIAYSDIPTYREPKRIEQLDCMVAASATFLYGRQLIAGDSLRWLRTYPPTERVGYSIYVFDLRKTHR